MKEYRFQNRALRLQRKLVLNKLYIDFINTGDEKYYNELYDNLRNILTSLFGPNPLFRDINFKSTWDDIFQNTMVKLYTKKDSFNVDKGNVITFASTIFNNNLIDEQRKIKVELVSIDSVDFDSKPEFNVY